MNVLKQHLQSAIFTLLERGVSQHRIHELTGIDRKTIRRYQALYEARRADGGQTDRKAAHERTYSFLSALAGDLPGYEEAIRALFAGEDETFAERMATWPKDIRDHALVLIQPNLRKE